MEEETPLKDDDFAPPEPSEEAATEHCSVPNIKERGEFRMSIEKRRKVAMIYKKHLEIARQNNKDRPVILHIAREAKVSKATVYKIEEELNPAAASKEPISEGPFVQKNEYGKEYNRGKAMSIEEKRKIAIIYNKHLKAAKESYRKGPVIADIAKEAKVSRSAVYKIAEELRQNRGDVAPLKKPIRKKGPGTQTLSAEDKALLLRLREEDCFRTRKSYCDELLIQHGTAVSVNTVGRFFQIPAAGDTAAIASADYDTLRLLGNNKIVYKNFLPTFQRMCNYVGKSRKCYKHFKEKFAELEQELLDMSKNEEPGDTDNFDGNFE